MKAMLLAAGRGLRLKPLTDDKPKPLVEVQDRPLIDYALASIEEAGIKECVINLRHKGRMIEDYVGAGDKWGIRIQYSRESVDLNTGGGVLNALPLLGRDVFLLVNSDLIHDINLADFIKRNRAMTTMGHLLLHSPPPATEGDFSLEDGLLAPGKDITFCGISLINPILFQEQVRKLTSSERPQVKDGLDDKSFPLIDIFNLAMQQGLLSGEIHKGEWRDLGTFESLKQANSQAC